MESYPAVSDTSDVFYFSIEDKCEEIVEFDASDPPTADLSYTITDNAYVYTWPAFVSDPDRCPKTYQLVTDSPAITFNSDPAVRELTIAYVTDLTILGESPFQIIGQVGSSTVREKTSEGTVTFLNPCTNTDFVVIESVVPAL